MVAIHLFAISVNSRDPTICKHPPESTPSSSAASSPGSGDLYAAPPLPVAVADTLECAAPVSAYTLDSG
jgi:hypothetical protein